MLKGNLLKLIEVFYSLKEFSEYDSIGVRLKLYIFESCTKIFSIHRIKINMTRKKDIKTPPKLFKETQYLMNSISKELDGDFISYWISSNSRITGDDTLPFYEILKSRKSKNTLYLFLKSDGGSGEGSLRIVNLLRQYYKKIIALTPLDCASAATMLALGADVIKMGPLAYLSSNRYIYNS